MWHIRFRDPRGQWFTRRITTNQVLHGMREGIWPAGVEAARGSHRKFRPLEVYPEFHSTQAPASVTPAPSPVQRKSQPIRGLRQWQVVISTGFGIGLLAAAALCRILLTL
jgi:hypothetical protein